MNNLWHINILPFGKIYFARLHFYIIKGCKTTNKNSAWIYAPLQYVNVSQNKHVIPYPSAKKPKCFRAAVMLEKLDCSEVDDRKNSLACRRAQGCESPHQSIIHLVLLRGENYSETEDICDAFRVNRSLLNESYGSVSIEVWKITAHKLEPG